MMPTEFNQSRPQIIINRENISQFSADVGALWATTIAETHEMPSPLTFLREHVSLSKPLLIHNAFPTKSLDEIIEESDNGSNNHDDLELHVDTTPDGHGDCIRVVNGERMFVMPEVRTMGLHELRRGLKSQQARAIQFESHRHHHSAHELDDNGLRKFDDSDRESGLSDEDCVESDSSILYYSRQNDCLRSELSSLAALFPNSIQFADETFDAKPDAVNLWIGNERSVSSMHKDHYENIFCVAQGQKVFTICPPADALFLKEKMFPSGTFRKDEGGRWTVDREVDEREEDVDGEASAQKVRWIEADIERLLPPSSQEDREIYLEKYPLLRYAHPIRIHVNAGDMLYLPALWYHRVTQTCETVAVNYWYDMRFDSPSWCHFNFLQHLERCDGSDNDRKNE